MDYHHKYLKYKKKYLQFKNQQGGIKYAPAVKLSRKKELNRMTTTKSYIERSANSKTRTYIVHDNGGRPFKVLIDSKGIHIFQEKYDENTDKSTYEKNILNFPNYEGYWFGFDSTFNKLHGNSILIQLKNKSYVYVGHEIYQFKTEDKIIDYYSPMGNSDVPYPVAVSENYLYFMLDKVYMPRNDFSTDITVANAIDLYSEFYGHSKNKRMNKHKMLDLKILQERVY